MSPFYQLKAIAMKNVLLLGFFSFVCYNNFAIFEASSALSKTILNQMNSTRSLPKEVFIQNIPLLNKFRLIPTQTIRFWPRQSQHKLSWACNSCLIENLSASVGTINGRNELIFIICITNCNCFLPNYPNIITQLN